jgi:hypothetical protein
MNSCQKANCQKCVQKIVLNLRFDYEIDSSLNTTFFTSYDSGVNMIIPKNLQNSYQIKNPNKKNEVKKLQIKNCNFCVN